MVERKAFLANPNHQYHEHDCSAHNKKKGDYYECPSLSHFTENFDFKQNVGKKNFSYKSKASILCIPMKRT